MKLEYSPVGFMAALACLAFGLQLAACGINDPAGRTDEPSGDGLGAGALTCAAIPGRNLDGSCSAAEVLGPVTNCEWFGALDAAVLGEIISVTFVDDLFIVPDGTSGGSKTVTACGDVASGYTTRIRIRPTLVLVGTVEGEIDVYVEHSHVVMWQPRPSRGADGRTLIWPDGDALLAAGDEIGVALHLDDRKNWTTAGEPLFVRGVGGTLTFQAGDEGGCGYLNPPPETVRLQDVTGFGNRCRTNAQAMKRREGLAARYPNSRANFCAPKPGSVSGDPPSPGACKSDFDCGAAATCMRGACNPAQ